MPSTVQNIIKNAAGVPVTGANVTIDLVVLPSGASIQGFYGSTDYTINIPATVQTNASGIWSMVLPANDEIEDVYGIANTTHWKVTESPGNRVYYIKFSNGDPSTIWAGDYTNNSVAAKPSSYPVSVPLTLPASLTMTASLTRINIGMIMDMSAAVEIRMDARVRTGSAGSLQLQYSLDNLTWTTVIWVNTPSTGIQSTGYIPIPGAARTLSYWQLATYGGTNGSAVVDLCTVTYR